MNRLFLVRHGENQANIDRQFSHRLVDFPLNAKGILQAQQTGLVLATKGIQEVYASPLKRARQTAEIIASYINLPVTIVEEFREIDTGDLEKQPASAANWAIHDGVFADWLAGRADRTMPGGEDYHSLWRRMQVGLEQALAGIAQHNILIVGHGGMFTVTLPSLCPGINVKNVLARPNSNCSITEIEMTWKDDRWNGTLIDWSRFDHLHGEAAALISGVWEDQ